jgi:hypothetical protein
MFVFEAEPQQFFKHLRRDGGSRRANAGRRIRLGDFLM